MDKPMAGIVKRGGKRWDCCNASAVYEQTTHIHII